VLIVAALVGGATASAYQHFATMAAAERAVNLAVGAEGPSDTFYTNATQLIAIAVGVAVLIGALGQLVSVTEAIVSRRRTYAALVATGVPRGVLARTQVWQSLVVAVPSFVLAATSGVLIIRGLFGAKVVAAGATYMDGDVSIVVPDVSRAVPLPWSGLMMVVGGSIAAVLLTVAIGILFLRTSTSVDELRTA
jgi:ABC-type antimicrobial peptide transport system permease subunit